MVVVAQRLTGHQSACGKWRVIAFESLVDLERGVSSFLLLSLIHKFPCFVLPALSHVPLQGWGVSEWLCGCLSSDQGYPTTIIYVGVNNSQVGEKQCCSPDTFFVCPLGQN